MNKEKAVADLIDFDKYLNDYPAWEKDPASIIMGLLSRSLLVARKAGLEKAKYKEMCASYIHRFWDEK